MAKIVNLFDNTMPLNFNSPEQHFRLYHDQFLKSELGGIYKAIPWQELINVLNLKRKTKGPQATFSLHAKVALMFLKSYTGLSDKKLLERLNADYQFQFFCDMYIDPAHPLENPKKISEARVELSENLNIMTFQKVLAKHWSDYIDPQVMLTDATCYESYICYPTDTKLLWEAILWVMDKIKGFYKLVKGSTPRSKFIEIKKRYLVYSRKRKKTHKQTTKMLKSLIPLLSKLLSQLSEIINRIGIQYRLDIRFLRRFTTIKDVLVQQKQLLAGQEVKNRIVSLDKEYVRPIIRGKENKRVEFGAKSNLMQFSGITFIEHLSYNAFNEGTRIESTVETARFLFEKPVNVLSADKIYATNKNRTFCKTEGIRTNFIPKGKPARDEKQQKQLRKELDKERSTRMEGAFGTQKNHYNIQKVKARTKETEILWILFGVHTLNAKLIATRIRQREEAGKQVA